jgi:hypothetical protein
MPRPTTRAGRNTGNPRGRQPLEIPNDTTIKFYTTAAVKEFVNSHGGATKFLNALINSAMTASKK